MFSGLNALSANPTKWSNTIKQFVGKGCLSFRQNAILRQYWKVIQLQLFFFSKRTVGSFVDLHFEVTQLKEDHVYCKNFETFLLGTMSRIMSFCNSGLTDCRKMSSGK